MGTSCESAGGANSNWKAEMAEYDAGVARRDAEFHARSVVVDADGLAGLSEEENALLGLVLAGHSCAGIAEMTSCTGADVIALLEAVRDKLGPEGQRAISITMTRT